MKNVLLALLGLSAAPSCLSLAPDAPPPTRWLSIMPDAPSAVSRTQGVATPVPNEPRIRIGSVVSTDAITDQFISRVSPVEIVYFDGVRWAESPAITVERAVRDELFRRNGFVQDDRAPNRLDLEVIAFEERMTPRREGRVGVVATLTGEDGQTLFNKRFETSVPVDGDDPALVAEALATGVARLAAEIVELTALK